MVFWRSSLRFLPVLFGVFAAGCAIYPEAYDGPVVSYAVKSGDTIASLSRRTGVPADSIIEINELDDPDELSAGQILYFPQGAKLARMPTRSLTAPAPSPLVGDLSFVKHSGAAPFIGKLYWPVHGGKLGSHFGARSGNFHEGIDIRADLGTSVYAAHDGVVVFSGKLWRGYGNMMILKGEGIYTVYAHNNANFLDDKEVVRAGDEIATVGQSGNASGPHLHFEVRLDDSRGYKVAVNPLIFLNGNY